MKFKKGDKVNILSGRDRGKTGKILQVFPKTAKVVVEGLNLRLKHQRPKKQGEKGQRIQFPAPINVSNVALICPKCGQKTRVGFEISKSQESLTKSKKRICRKCRAAIE